MWPAKFLLVDNDCHSRDGKSQDHSSQDDIQPSARVIWSCNNDGGGGYDNNNNDNNTNTNSNSNSNSNSNAAAAAATKLRLLLQ